MKILVYGAGIIGSIIASQLTKIGQNVTVLARGKHAADLRTFGIVTHPMDGEDYHTSHPTVIESLSPEDTFDVILVVMRRNSHQEILPILAQNQHFQKVVFLGNNLGSGADILEYLPAEKVVLGFGGTTGEKRGDIIYHYTDEETGKQGMIVMGEITGVTSPILLELKNLLEAAGFETEISPNADAWLKSHAALVLPLAFGLYLCDGNNYRLAKTRDALLLTCRGVKEGFKVLRRLTIPILPPKFRLLPWIPEPVAVVFLRKLFATEFARIGLATHANNAKDEMYFLADEFKSLIQQSGVETPTLNQLYAVTEQAQTGQVILPEGAHSKPLDWKPIWITAGILTGIVGAIGYLLTHRKKK